MYCTYVESFHVSDVAVVSYAKMAELFEMLYVGRLVWAQGTIDRVHIGATRRILWIDLCSGCDQSVTVYLLRKQCILYSSIIERLPGKLNLLARCQSLNWPPKLITCL